MFNQETAEQLSLDHTARLLDLIKEYYGLDLDINTFTDPDLALWHKANVIGVHNKRLELLFPVAASQDLARIATPWCDDFEDFTIEGSDCNDAFLAEANRIQVLETQYQ
tara:strand:+ start:376 stop:702 length:327 start_codon:yes stop_codon:yes gene_type:complete